MITFLVKQVSIKMTEQEAMVLRKLLGMLPSAKPMHGEVIKIDSTKIGDNEYSVLNQIYKVIENHGI